MGSGWRLVAAEQAPKPLACTLSWPAASVCRCCPPPRPCLLPHLRLREEVVAARVDGEERLLLGRCSLVAQRQQLWVGGSRGGELSAQACSLWFRLSAPEANLALACRSCSMDASVMVWGRLAGGWACSSCAEPLCRFCTMLPGPAAFVAC